MGGSGDDILFGQDGADKIAGNAGEDWLIGGDDKDVLDGGPGRDEVKSGDNSSRQLREAIAARQIDWEGAFGNFGQPFVPFGVNGTKFKSPGNMDDYLVLSEKNEETV